MTVSEREPERSEDFDTEDMGVEDLDGTFISTGHDRSFGPWLAFINLCRSHTNRDRGRLKTHICTPPAMFVCISCDRDRCSIHGATVPIDRIDRIEEKIQSLCSVWLARMLETMFTGAFGQAYDISLRACKYLGSAQWCTTVVPITH